MRTFLLFLVCAAWLLVPDLARADLAAAVRAFDEGNEHYAIGNYQAAIDNYERALQEGYASVALLQNLGNAYFRIDELGEAIRAYETARLLEPDDPEILHNISIATERTVDRFSRLPDPILVSAWNRLRRPFGAWGFFAVGGVLWIVAGSAGTYRILTANRSAWTRRVMVLAAVGGLAFLGAAFAASAETEWKKRGVIVARETTVYSEPSRAAEETLRVREGVVVDVTGVSADWLHVRLPNGVRGWATAEAVGLIGL